LAEKIAQTAQIACILEVSALKPGNVNRRYDFEDTRFEDFLLSAIAIRPALQSVGRSQVGQIIWQAIQDTHRLVRSNTNLGIVLLLAPLAKACFRAQSDNIRALREELAQVLDGLTLEDARKTYAAIRLAQAGGLGRNVQADVADEPEITLLQAMALAQGRDAIAREYVTRFAITFEIGFPAIEAGWIASKNLPMAIVQGYLTILSKVPDTLIARKRGIETARRISQHAAGILDDGGTFSEPGRQALIELDQQLRTDGHSLNPGTTADLTTASLFLFLYLRADRNDTLWPISFDYLSDNDVQGNS
jgi:triphosphoribosyl-dephospho-CoA synthase